MYLSPFHLCHCMNIYPGTTLQDKIITFTESLPKLRDRIPNARNVPFAAGLWLNADAVSTLIHLKQTKEFASFLRSLGYYAFTANAFPFGTFHNETIKTKVYTPDWTTQARVDYTCAVADVLSEMIPGEEIPGSISTLPGAYHTFPKRREPEIARNLLSVAAHLRKLRDKTGRTIRLAVEMEPDCLWESPRQFAEFFERYLADEELGEWIGVCYDTCHQELLGNPPGSGLDFLMSRGIAIPKIQLSAALYAPDSESKHTLAKHFLDPVYLHQTRAVSSQEGILRRWDDLPDAIRDDDASLPWTVHFHVPVFLDSISGGLRTAKGELLAVLQKLKQDPAICPAIEIETYSYQVMPEFSKSASLEDSMAQETCWVMQQLGLSI